MDDDAAAGEVPPLPASHPFVQAATPLQAAVDAAMQGLGAGVLHRQLQSACFELVLLFGKHAVPGLEGDHTRAAAHYLSAACTSAQRLHTFTDAITALSTTALPSADGLPAGTLADVAAAAATEQHAADVAKAVAVGADPPAPHPPAGGDADAAPLAPSAHAVLCHLLAADRETLVLPVDTVCVGTPSQASLAAVSARATSQALAAVHAPFASSVLLDAATVGVPPEDVPLPDDAMVVQWRAEEGEQLGAPAKGSVVLSEPSATLVFLGGACVGEDRFNEPVLQRLSAPLSGVRMLCSRLRALRQQLAALTAEDAAAADVHALGDGDALAATRAGVRQRLQAELFDAVIAARELLQPEQPDPDTEAGKAYFEARAKRSEAAKAAAAEAAAAAAEGGGAAAGAGKGGKSGKGAAEPAGGAPAGVILGTDESLPLTRDTAGRLALLLDVRSGVKVEDRVFTAWLRDVVSLE